MFLEGKCLVCVLGLTPGDLHDSVSWFPQQGCCVPPVEPRPGLGSDQSFHTCESYTSPSTVERNVSL